ncbi:hypothetical protein CN395_29935 [Priestia megaterium]|jgi:hypothetical protein|uniref:hypothetical protein n=1 Tax=Priestia TaxID=2800373 RepID=UPI000BF6E3AE|nr:MULTISPECIES: hypothetical protein [Priestia]MED4046257.1 hypothetical protein [Priestia aryabhattai]MUL33918.1 hypothetical protein [Priestia megaterium]PES93767.1 hypothetical protein CN510_17485 [Priestia megaterium]PEU50256.1 hypothetical protein CN395_29935 [Priestia megaterium]PFI59448.1 hypothetical protein COI68_27075 [Priestia megaterium]
MNSISKELERILEDYAPIVKEGQQVLIGLLDGTVQLEKGQEGEAPMQIRVSPLDERLEMTIDTLFQGM